jgi:lysozyme family protein
MAGYFDHWIEEILKVEGGYVNDPEDSGGETNCGITIALARKHGYSGPMKDLPRPKIVEIYKKEFWDALLCDEIQKISLLICSELLDTAVNQGVFRAAEYLQRSLNVLNKEGALYADLKVDGAVGRKTVAALAAYTKARPGAEGVKVLLSALNCLQGAFYISLAERRQKDERFVYGWLLNRVTI